MRPELGRAILGAVTCLYCCKIQPVSPKRREPIFGVTKGVSNRDRFHWVQIGLTGPTLHAKLLRLLIFQPRNSRSFRVRDVGVAGSNPVTPTIENTQILWRQKALRFQKDFGDGSKNGSSYRARSACRSHIRCGSHASHCVAICAGPRDQSH